MSLLAILAEIATVRRDATHDVTGAVWTRSAPEIGLGSPGILRCATGDEMAMSFENAAQIILEEASRLNSDPTEHDKPREGGWPTQHHSTFAAQALVSRPSAPMFSNSMRKGLHSTKVHSVIRQLDSSGDEWAPQKRALLEFDVVDQGLREADIFELTIRHDGALG